MSLPTTKASRERVPLLDARLELTRHLTEDERAELAGVNLPVVTLGAGPLELEPLLRHHSAFGATVLDGMVMHAVRIGEQTGIQLLGPGDLLVPRNDTWSSWLSESEYRTTAPVRLGVLGNELLAAAYRWPRVVQGLYSRIADQMQRLTGQLVICQLPRVDQRLLAIMWLLAESWGQVTPGGIRLPLVLTHETLGALVGARRPTVTLALRELSKHGAVIHQDSGWLLIERPPEPATDAAKFLPPEVQGAAIARWTAPPAPPPDPSIAYAELRDTVRRLRAQHDYDRRQMSERLARIKQSRTRMMSARERIARDSLSRRRPPSS